MSSALEMGIKRLLGALYESWERLVAYWTIDSPGAGATASEA
jgi:hypothetical protein